MGRPRKHVPRQVCASDHRALPSTKFFLSTEKRILLDFIKFCVCNHDQSLSGLKSWCQQLVADDVDKGGIAHRVQYVTSCIGVTNSCQVALKRCRRRLKFLQRLSLAKVFAKQKRSIGGHKKKPLISLSTLRLVLKKKKIPHKNHSLWRVFWWLLCVTGGRPANLTRSPVILKESELLWYPRNLKANGGTTAVSAIPRSFPLGWSFQPPRDVRAYLLRKRRAPNFKSKTAASCCNSWLQRVGLKKKVTSTSPRVRLDNVLRIRVLCDLMSKDDFVFLMNHSWETSTKYYARIV